jgi:prolyl 4-hydroxylase
MSVDQTSWVQQLPLEWQTWLMSNLERGCDPTELGQILRDNGFQADDLGRLEQHDTKPTQQQAPVVAQQRQAFSLDHLLASNQNFCELDGQTIRIVAHLQSPSVLYFEDVLSAEECDDLIGLSEQAGKLKRSTVVDTKDGSKQIDQRRLSDSTSYQRGEHPLVARIEQRIAQLVNWPVNHGEGLQILRYQQGGEYRPHMDFFDPKYAGSAKHLAVGGQRVATFIIYLSDVEAGGGTKFPNLGLEFRPKKGAALLFGNTDDYGQPHPDSLHAGMPVIAGTKYIATKWLREYVYG